MMKKFDKSIFIGKFTEEAKELIQKLDDGLLKLESEPADTENIIEILRHAHTLKGSSRMIGFKNISEVAHKMEDLLTAVKNETLTATETVCDTLFKGLDAIKDLLERVANNTEGEADVTEITELLAKVAAGESIEPKEPKPSPEPSSALTRGHVPLSEEDESTPPAKEETPPPPPKKEKRPFKKTFDKSIFIGKFMTEATELIQKLNEGLLKLEDSPDDKENITEILRHAHTLKGSGRMLSFGNVGTVAHKMEDLLSAIKTEKIQVTDTVTELLFQGLDTIQGLVDRVTAGTESEAEVSEIVDLLEQAAAGEEVQLPETTPLSEKTDPPVEEEEEDIEEIEETSSPPAQKTTEKTPPQTPQAKKKVEVIETIRVSTEKLDQTIKLAGELLVTQGQISNQLDEMRALRLIARRVLQDQNGNAHPALSELAGRIDSLFKRSREYGADLTGLISDLQENTLSLRMQPLSTLFDKYPRAVRDLAKSLGKKARLVVEGEETELDKKIIEKLNDPMIHLIRNAIDHGIESPDDRLRRGKNSVGMVRLGAYYESGSITIEIEDDGKGIDVEAVKQKALKRGLISEEDARKMKDRDVRQLIFLPGLSTNQIITDVSGRGVGMDVVRTYIEELKGTISIQSDEGRGTKFTIILPLTLTMLRVLFVQTGNMRFAIPINSIRLTLRLSQKQVIQIVDRDAIRLDNQIIPLANLAHVLQLPEEGAPFDHEYLSVVLAYAGEDQIGLVVDEIIDEEDVVVKSLPDHVGRVTNISGVTLTSDNDIVSILHVPDLVKTSRTSVVRRQVRHEKKEEDETTLQKILVVDDSLNTREIEKSVLEAYGYDVDVARDGQEGYEKCEKSQFDLVVTDVEMPRLDGFTLTERLRLLDDYRDVPIIIVTSRDTEADKERGIKVGADAYIVKSSFEQSNLLSTVESLIG